MRIFRLIIMFGCLVCSGWAAKAQLNMPTSVEGLGIPSPKIPSGFGGAPALAISTTLFSGINYSNPASYANFQYMGFDMGVKVESTNYTYSPTLLQRSYNQIDFTNVHIGFPIKSRKIGFVIGAYPFAKMGYKLGYASGLVGTTSQDSVLNLSQGTGGSQVLHIGLGVRIFKNWSLGLNLGYLSGSQRRENLKIFQYSNYLTTSTRLDIFFGSLYSTLGVMGKIPLSNSSSLNLGATASLPLGAVSATRDGYFGSFYDDNLVDTIVLYKQASADMKLPASYELGLSYGSKTEHFLLGLNFRQTFWSEFSTSVISQNFIYQYQDDWELGAGLSIRPIRDMSITTTKKSYFGYVSYQVGGYYSMTRLKELSTGNRLSQYGVSVGMQLPLRKYNYSNQFGSIILNLRYNAQGSSQNLFSSSGFTFQLGFILSDLWFMKRKFD